MRVYKASFLLTFSILLLIACYTIPSLLLDNAIKTSAKFEEVLHHKEVILESQLQELEIAFEAQALETIDWQDEDLSYFIFDRDSLIYWSDDEVVVDLKSISNQQNIYQSSNGWYYKKYIKNNDTTIVGLALIRSEYPIENQYLQNTFQEDFQFSTIDSIKRSPTPLSIQNKNGDTLFYLTEKQASPSKAHISFFTILLIIACLSLSVVLPFSLKIKKLQKVLLAGFIALLLRVLLFLKLPVIFQSTHLFQSNWFAINQFIPSLGDLLLHLILIFYLSYLLKLFLRFNKSKPTAILVLLLSFFLGAFTVFVVKWSIQASTINYNLSNLYDLNYLSFIAFFSFTILICSCFILFDTALKLLQNSFQRKTPPIFISSLIYLLIVILLPSFNLILLWVFIPLLLIHLHLVRTKKQNIFIAIVLLLFSSSIIAYQMNRESVQRENTYQKNIIQKLAEERDPVAEYLFNELQPYLRNDRSFLNMISHYWKEKEQVDNYLKTNYFNSYWDKYLINFSLCSPADSLLISSDEASVSCFDYFQNRIRLEGDMVSSNNLFRLTNLAGRIDYIGEIELLSDSVTYHLYIELSSIYLNENEGYPELLVDKKSKSESVDLSNYSYAVYDKNELVYSSGDYNYSTRLKINELVSTTFYQYQTDYHQHLVYQKDQDVAIILSKASPNFFDFLTSLAYLSVILTIVFLLLALTLPNFPFYFELNLHDFSSKIQIFLVGSLLSSLILLAWGTAYYIKDQYQEKNSKHLEEKIRSVNIELESKIGKEEFFSPALESYVSSYLVKFSNVFYSDINLYNTNGTLYSTSRPEVYNKGIKSTRMNPIAFRVLKKENKAQWIQQESIGEMNYLSAYIPFKNFNNEIIGYLNLPYFSRQGELEEEISSFLVSTLNIYVGFFALALLISVLLINQLSKPLLIIREQIAKLKIGSSIELIEWKSNDEIGALVQEYNKIAIELNDSAALLAKSEREVAWREMAKQVAHEIKNPLTPMKLSIQHLQRAAANQSDDLEERIQRTTQTLVEQIETLSNIATAFSSFAKLPGKNFQRLDIIPIIQNTIDLYSHDSSIKLELLTKESSLFVQGDKDQLLRVFNNLIKNAVQATEENDEPIIHLSIDQIEEELEIKISDNGIGIDQAQASRIFEPNFTTKSSGSGLGLAMSKSIIEQMQGSIHFNSIEKEGTTFIIRLPKAGEFN